MRSFSTSKTGNLLPYDLNCVPDLNPTEKKENKILDFNTRKKLEKVTIHIEHYWCPTIISNNYVVNISLNKKYPTILCKPICTELLHFVIDSLI
jgi:hypothetical protein